MIQALKWLKQHNPLYRDITITKMSEDMFNHKEEKVTDGENVNEDILEMDETGIVRLDALQPVVEAVDLMQGSIPIEKQIQKLQIVTTTPLSVFENQNDLKVLAFPTLYPNGENGFGTIREVKVSPLEYFQTRMLSDDSRWACHPAYIFWACNIVEALKLQSSISIAMRMRSFRIGHCEKSNMETNEKELLTAGLLQESVCQRLATQC